MTRKVGKVAENRLKDFSKMARDLLKYAGEKSLDGGKIAQVSRP